jgi:hypothetical protein
MRLRKAASGSIPVPAWQLSAICVGFPVPGITHVTAGSASTNFRRICAQLVQPISPAQSGSGRLLRRHEAENIDQAARDGIGRHGASRFSKTTSPISQGAWQQIRTSKEEKIALAAACTLINVQISALGAKRKSCALPEPGLRFRNTASSRSTRRATRIAPRCNGYAETREAKVRE